MEERVRIRLDPSKGRCQLRKSAERFCSVVAGAVPNAPPRAVCHVQSRAAWAILQSGGGGYNMDPQRKGEQALVDATEQARHGFKREQIDYLQETFLRKSTQGFDRPTQMWLIGGLVAMSLAIAGAIWAEIGSVREELSSEIRSVRGEISSVRDEIRSVRDEIRENRAAIAELTKGQARIEAILNERLPRGR